MTTRFPYEDHRLFICELLQEGRRRLSTALLLDEVSETDVRRNIQKARVLFGEVSDPEGVRRAFYPGAYGEVRSIRQNQDIRTLLYRYGSLGLTAKGFYAVVDAIDATIWGNECDPAETYKRGFHLARAALDVMVRLLGPDGVPLYGLEEAKATERYDWFPACVMFCDWHNEFEDESFEIDLWDCWSVFCIAWDNIASTPSQSPLQRAAANARSTPVRLKFKTGPGIDKYELVAGIAYYLQRERGDLPIMLPVKDVGSMIYPDQKMPAHNAARIINALSQRGLLQCTDAAYNFTAKKAKEYRFEFNASDLYELPTK